MQQHGDSRVIHPYTGLGGLCIRVRRAPSSPAARAERAAVLQADAGVKTVCHLKPCAIYRLCRLSPVPAICLGLGRLSPSARGRRLVVRGSKTSGSRPVGAPFPSV